MMPAQVASARGPIDALLGVPGELGAALRTLPEIAESTKSMAADTARLREVGSILERITEDTGPMKDRIESISDTMPLLVKALEHIAELPEALARLETRLDGVTEQMERMVESVVAVAATVVELQESMGPVSRLARRLPGERKREREAAAAQQAESGDDAE
jgi:hypothetical protein